MAELIEKHRILYEIVDGLAPICVACGSVATAFRDSESRRRYTISGFCQACQDAVFGVNNSDNSNDSEL